MYKFFVLPFFLLGALETPFIGFTFSIFCHFEVREISRYLPCRYDIELRYLKS
jgi:hypothetical protein